MSATVKLSTRLPADPETNGIDTHAKNLCDNPRDILVCVTWVDVQKVMVDTDTGDHVPTIRVRRIEPLGSPLDVPPAIRDAVQEAVEARTGRTPLPFDQAEPDAHLDDE